MSSSLAQQLHLKNPAWITWEVQVRNRSMASSLGIPLHELVIKKSRWIKYPLLIIKTFNIIRNHKIQLLFVQNPSIVLSFLAICLQKVYGLDVIVDAHNAGIYPLEGRNTFLNSIARFIAKNANLVIVSNSYLAQVVEEWGGKPFVMPDPIPALHSPVHNVKPTAAGTRPYIFFICTWANDEPYFEVITAAESVSDVFDIYITGNFKKVLRQEDIGKLPGNVKLLGFVSEDDYVHYFSTAFAAMDLTTRDHCLVCGAYEAIALKVPTIISDSAVNRETFNQGFVYSENDANGIAQAINSIAQSHERYTREIREAEQMHRKNTDAKISALIANALQIN